MKILLGKEVHVRKFTFRDDDIMMNSAWLNKCDVFYLAGGAEKDITAMFVEFQPQLHVI